MNGTAVLLLIPMLLLLEMTSQEHLVVKPMSDTEATTDMVLPTEVMVQVVREVDVVVAASTAARRGMISSTFLFL